MHCLYNYCKFVAIYVAITKIEPTKKRQVRVGITWRHTALRPTRLGYT